jgi:hypothetical protein
MAGIPQWDDAGVAHPSKAEQMSADSRNARPGGLAQLLLNTIELRVSLIRVPIGRRGRCPLIQRDSCTFQQTGEK